MQEQLISLETAKLAKEKGFNEWCTTAYINRPYLCEYHIADNYFKYTCKEDFPLVTEASIFIAPKAEPYYKAPTQSLLQKWLRDVYKLHIGISVNQFGYGFHYSVIDLNISNCVILLSNKTGGPNYKYSYEEALEAGLQEALKLIK